MKKFFITLAVILAICLSLTLFSAQKAEAAYYGGSFWNYSSGCPTSATGGPQTGYTLGAEQNKVVAYNQDTLTVKLYGSIGVCPYAYPSYKAYWSNFMFSYTNSKINSGNGIDSWFFAALGDYIYPGEVRNFNKDITIDVSSYPRDGKYYTVSTLFRGGSSYPGSGKTCDLGTDWDCTQWSWLDIKFQMEAIGNISVSKYYPSSKTPGNYSNIPSDVNNALVKLYAKTNTADRFQFATSNDKDYVTSSPNPFTRNTVLTSQNQFRARTYIPSGKKVTRLSVGGYNRSCINGSDSEGSYCETPSFSVSGGKTTEVNVFYDDESPPPPPEPTLYYPFLQVQQGNLTANGQINGQVISDKPSAPDSVDKYTEYLVISAISDGGPFCSLKNYILTNTSATIAGNCNNGSGYGVLPDYLFGGSSDKVYTAVSKKYDGLSDACKSTTAPTSTISVPSGCSDGFIYKINSNLDLGRLTVSGGRATLLVNGDVTIKDMIDYANPVVGGGLAALKTLPNLSIVTNKNIKINSNVTNVNASLYSVGYINTCGDKALPLLCNTQLNVFGGLAAKNGLILGRVNGTNGLTGHAPAELIKFYPLSAVLSTPGTSSFDFDSSSSATLTDPAEYPPRF